MSSETRSFQLLSCTGRAEAMVAFTAKFRHTDVLHLSPGLTLKFDYVVYNAGNGYNPQTGFFTAPSAGTYAFYINVSWISTVPLLLLCVVVVLVLLHIIIIIIGLLLSCESFQHGRKEPWPRSGSVLNNKL